MVRPSPLNVPCTKFHWSALTTFCDIPTKRPVEESPFSLVKVRNTPLPLTEQCLVRSPWAHQSPRKPEFPIGPCGGGIANGSSLTGDPPRPQPLTTRQQLPQ